MKEFLANLMANINDIFSKMFIHLVVAAVILLVGFIIGKLLGKLVQRLLHEAEVDNILKKAGVRISLEVVIGTFTSYFIYFVTVIMALNQIGLTTSILQIISAGVIILIILFTILALKDFIPNMIAGLIIYQKEIVKIGDRIKIHNLEGKVSKISLIETEIITTRKDMIHIPNSNLLKSELAVKKRKR